MKLQHTAAGTELRNKAVGVVRRVVQKLNGLDFTTQQQGRSRSLRAHQPLAVEEQVDKLIAQASSNENLCLSYIGWCPFW
jgi:serine/threonine-protein kinase mTOR